MQVFVQARALGMLCGNVVRESDGDAYAGKTLLDSRKAELEEKIRRLRNLMEQAAEDENSFTSEAVVQISMKLDELINDYQQFMMKDRNRRN